MNKQMGFPFQDDRIAMARLDWCRAGDDTDCDGLSCILRARMCAAHVQASENPGWAQLAAPAFAGLLAAAKVDSWTPCPEGRVSGTCGLLLADRYGPALWKALGAKREAALYESVFSGNSPPPTGEESVVLPACAYPTTEAPPTIPTRRDSRDEY